MSNQHSINDIQLRAFYELKKKECPKRITLKLQEGKYLLLQFIDPTTGKRTSKSCEVDYTESGIVQAVYKANRVSDALISFQDPVVFWTWYNREILKKPEQVTEFICYGEIFDIIEQRYWNGRNKNTKRLRSKNIPNDVSSFDRYYGHIFKLFSNRNATPKFSDIKEALFTFKPGSKSFKDAYLVLKNICELAVDSESLLAQLARIDHNQTEFIERQSISLEEFLEWHESVLNDVPVKDGNHQTKRSWLWVASMCVVYGLRPSEVAAIQNLLNPYCEGSTAIPALYDPDNKDLLLVLNDKTYFGATVKTGKRICKPMTTDKQILLKLYIQNPLLPQVKFNPELSAKCQVEQFANAFRKRLIAYGCPVTQAYAFRHLANQLGEREGIPQEIRARSLGHSVSTNEGVYKKRSNLATSVDLLTNHSKQPMSYEEARKVLDRYTYPLMADEVQEVLDAIYRLN